MQRSHTDLGTAIILAIEDEFRLKFKKEVSENRKFIACLDLKRSPNVSRLIITHRSTARQTDEQAFLGQVRAAVKNHPIYSVVTRSAQGQQRDYIKRKCQYEKIRNKQELIDYVYKYCQMGGLYVDEELLNYSYPAISRDIEAAVKEKQLIRALIIGKSPENCYLFYNFDTMLGVNTAETNEFQEEYLWLCKEYHQKDERVFEENKALDICVDIDENDPNYRLSNFLELKKQWKIKQTCKAIVQQEEDRKATARELTDDRKKLWNSNSFTTWFYLNSLKNLSKI